MHKSDANETLNSETRSKNTRSQETRIEHLILKCCFRDHTLINKCEGVRYTSSITNTYTSHPGFTPNHTGYMLFLLTGQFQLTARLSLVGDVLGSCVRGGRIVSMPFASFNPCSMNSTYQKSGKSMMGALSFVTKIWCNCLFQKSLPSNAEGQIGIGLKLTPTH